MTLPSTQNLKALGLGLLSYILFNFLIPWGDLKELKLS